LIGRRKFPGKHPGNFLIRPMCYAFSSRSERDYTLEEIETEGSPLCNTFSLLTYTKEGYKPDAPYSARLHTSVDSV